MEQRISICACGNWVIAVGFMVVVLPKQVVEDPIEGRRMTSSSSTLEHRGYNGAVQYSAEDRLLHGSVLGIRDMITYEGESVDQLEANFRAAVDEYLAIWAE